MGQGLGVNRTTVEPHSLFLHAANSATKWQNQQNKVQALAESATDLRTAIPLGGLITLAVLSTAATAYFGKGLVIANAGDLALSLEPAFGPAAKPYRLYCLRCHITN